MSNTLTPFFWVAIALPTLWLLNRWIHTHLHGVSLLLTGKQDRAVIIYAIILLPGVLLHELSHWVVAKLLRVRTGSLSLLPRRQRDGSIQLGYVEYYRGKTLDPVRESLVGGAPLIVGTAVILLIGLRVFDVTGLVTAVQSGDLDIISLALSNLFDTDYILVWVYLLFAISSAMLPSASDRRAWPAFLVIMVVLAVVLYLLGLQDEVVDGLAGPATIVFGYLGIAFSIAIGAALFFMAIIALLEYVVGRVKGVSIVYGAPKSSQ